MKRHPEIGYWIVQATPELADVADFILSHHERWDGKGYPRGLREKEIPLVCRILAMTDAYDAMTSDRVYRKAKNSEEAILELKKNAGIQFDSYIVSGNVPLTEKVAVPKGVKYKQQDGRRRRAMYSAAAENQTMTRFVSDPCSYKISE